MYVYLILFFLIFVGMMILHPKYFSIYLQQNHSLSITLRKFKIDTLLFNNRVLLRLSVVNDLFLNFQSIADTYKVL